jgi:aubergine-like protein
MKQHGDGLVLLNVDITHKVIRMDNALEHIRRIMETTRKVDPKEMVNQKLRGTIVLTKYNINTYRIDDVDFTRTPYSTFQKANGESTSFAHYFSAKYCETVTDMKQPLLLVTPIRNKTRRREGHGPVYLVPELCHLTGLSDEMRANFTLMKELAKHLHKSPMERVEALNDFMAQLQEKTQVRM